MYKTHEQKHHEGDCVIQMFRDMINMMNETISLVQKVVYAMGRKRYVENR